MSGGSYNYLHHMWDLEDAANKLGDLEQMAVRLETLSEAEFPGASAAAHMTRLFILKIQTWEAHRAATVDHMAGVWKAVEWWDSSDWGPDSVREALDELTGKKK